MNLINCLHMSTDNVKKCPVNYIYDLELGKVGGLTLCVEEMCGGNLCVEETDFLLRAVKLLGYS